MLYVPFNSFTVPSAFNVCISNSIFVNASIELFGFENLKAIHRTSDVECFLVSIDSNIKVEKPFLSQVKIVYKYLVFYLFFFDISNPSSVIQILNYY